MPGESRVGVESRGPPGLWTLDSRLSTLTTLKIAVAQIDTTVGDRRNSKKILSSGAARKAGAPTSSLSGLPSAVTRRGTRRAAGVHRYRSAPRGSRAAARWALRLSRRTRRAWAAGSSSRDRGPRGRIAAVYHKRLLPTYDVFDEGRYTEPGIARSSRLHADHDLRGHLNDKTFWKHPLYRPIPCGT